MLRCWYCGNIIKPPKKKFCCNKHKDKYHNDHNPRGYYEHLNPDSPNYIEDSIEGIGHKFDPYEDDHPFSMDATNWGGAKD